MKQVIILRKDLNMRKGKMIAQGAHASIEATFKAMEQNPEWYNSWYTDEKGRMKKIVVSVDTLEALLSLYERATIAGLPTALIQDAGLTEFTEPTFTAVALGPAPEDAVDLFTKELPLL